MKSLHLYESMRELLYKNKQTPTKNKIKTTADKKLEKIKHLKMLKDLIFISFLCIFMKFYRTLGVKITISSCKIEFTEIQLMSIWYKCGFFLEIM